MVGLESALSVVQTAMVDTGLLGWTDVARVLSAAPAAIGRLDGYDAPFAVGAPAHLTLVDPAARRTFAVEHLQGRSVNSPYLGVELPGRVVATVHGGVPTVLDGVLRDADLVGKAGAHVDRLLPTLVIVGIIALVFVGLALGWRARQRRQADLPALSAPPATLERRNVHRRRALRRDDPGRRPDRPHRGARARLPGPCRCDRRARRPRSRHRRPTRLPSFRSQRSSVSASPPGPSTASSGRTASSSCAGTSATSRSTPTCARPTPTPS